MPKLKSQKILVTAALPYANGSIHAGHLIEYIQADIFARFLKLTGKDVIYICASDMHGTPIEVNAAKEGIKPEQLVEKYWKEHQEDFASFLIKFDNYYKTHSRENEELSLFFFNQLNKKGYVYTKEVEQYYDEKAKRFLPDRYIKGQCPKCSAFDQYGDVCEVCGATYNVMEVVNPKSVMTDTKPVLKKSVHYFFKLSAFEKFLKDWLTKSNVQPEVKNWLDNWLAQGLQDWCISRDEPYFGFEIPNSKKETGAKKYFYVWLDAPIGYISSTKNYCDKIGKDYKNYWKKGRVMHFIGKDIVYFHFLFWPAMLKGVGFNLPEINVHGFLTVNGKKMSKSRGTFITAKEFLEKHNAEHLRFYYANYLTRKLVDIDLDFDNFKAIINNILVSNISNFCYRVLSFIEKNYNGKVDRIAEDKIVNDIKKKIVKIKESYEKLEIKEALAEIINIATMGNAYFQEKEPWKSRDSSKEIVGLAANMVRDLAILMQPVIPDFSKSIQEQLGEKDLSWDDISFNKKIKVKSAKITFTKIEAGKSMEKFPALLKVGKVLKIEDHPNADSLYLLEVDTGEKRQLVAGLKKYYKKEELLGKNLVVCVNLKPAVIRGKESKGMILAADDGNKVVPLLANESKPGDSVFIESHESSSQEIDIDLFKKLNLKVKDKKVFWKDSFLKTNKEVIKANLKDGSEVR